MVLLPAEEGEGGRVLNTAQQEEQARKEGGH
jgi:hypothetical protein